MHSSKLPVAKRTRMGCDKFLYERFLKERAKKGRTSGAPNEVECVDLDLDEDDEGLSVQVEKGPSSKSKKCTNDAKMEPDGLESDSDVVELLDSSGDDDEGVGKYLSDEGEDSDILVISVIDMAGEDDDTNDDGKEDEAKVSDDLSYKSTSSEDESFSSDDDESDVSYREETRVVRSDHDESLDDSSSCDDELEDQGEDDSDDDDEVIRSRVWERKDVKCKGNGRMDRRKHENVEYRVKRKVDDSEFEESNSRMDKGGQRGNQNDKRKHEYRVKRKVDAFEFEESNSGKGRMDNGGQRGNKNDKRKLGDVEKGKVDPSEFEVSDSWNDMSSVKYGGTFKNGKNVGKKNEERTDDRSGLKKRTESPDVADRFHSRSVEKCLREKVNSCQDTRFDPKFEFVEFFSSSESDNEEIRGNYVKRDGRERQKDLKMAAKRKAGQNLDGLKILADSLHDEGEALKKFQEEKPQYKFRFKDEDEKPVEKSDFDKHVDDLFKQMDMCLAFEDIEIGSTPLDVDRSLDHTKEVDNGDQCKTQTDPATLCSRGIHHLVLDEQIGIICKYSSHVNQEIKHILPTFSKPSPRTRRRSCFAQSGCPIYSDDFRYTGAGRHDSENYNITGTVWDLVPGTRSSMYEHQREGFEFIWKNLAGGIIIEELEKPLSSSGSGCIISHAPGTGKTRLTIIFLQSFMKLYPDSRPVIIAPKSMLLTWEEELKKWKINIPFHNMNNLEYSGQENPAAVSVSGKGRDSRNSKTLTRLVKLLSWKMDKSILGVTYALFDKLVREATKNSDCTPIVKRMGKALLHLPSLVVLDEGHTPRNDQSSIYQSLLDVETERRIILSGTPFQNNFDELYNTLRLVNPKFDGGMKKNLRNISKELKSKWSGHKLGELKCMISPFVHVHKGKILQKSCPGLKDALIRLQPTDLQQELTDVLSTNGMKAGYLELSYVSSLVSVHPSLLPKRYFQEHQFSTYKDKLEKLERDPYSGAKTKFVVELCRLSEALNEKVLIYSQYINPLIFTKKQLQTYFGWTEGREVLYMNGNLEAKQRQSLISSLNDPKSKVRVLLASIKACSEGINLVGASRVVLLDVVWNPSVERQAISRAYRLGQKKMVYTYHLIGEEMDDKKYKAQTAKDRLSEIVFSSNDRDSCKENVPNIVCEDEILQKMLQHNDKLGGMFKQIIYQPKDSNLTDTYDLVAVEPS